MSLTEKSLNLIILSFIKISPDEGLSISERRFNNVDFPEPDGPTRE
jgi:hypothetical protein